MCESVFGVCACVYACVAYLERGHELDGGDERERRPRPEVVSHGLQEVQRVEPDVDEHVKHLDAGRSVDRDCAGKKR